MSAADRLAEIEARIEAATEGPWFGSGGGLYVYGATMGDEVAKFARRADAKFARRARADVPWLIEQLRSRDKALDAVLALADMSDDGSEYEHNEGCEGEAECPACWAASIRDAITEALDGAA